MRELGRFGSISTPFFLQSGHMDSDAVASGGSTLDNNPTIFTPINASRPEGEDIDPIWLSSRTARQIYGLCQVEKVSQVPPIRLLRVQRTNGQ